MVDHPASDPPLDLRAHLDGLRRLGLLVDVDEPVDKDAELIPLVRWQFRGLPPERRRAFLFRNVTDGRGRRFEGAVAVGALGASPRIYAAAFGCEAPEEVPAAWQSALDRPRQARRVAAGPVQTVVLRGPELTAGGGVDAFPHPIATPGFDPAPFLTAACWISRDPDTGVYNAGTYRGMVKAPDRVGLQLDTPAQHLARHLEAARALGRELEVAVVIGAPPALGLASVSKLPYGVSEYEVAGGIQGEPLAVVGCRTVDLEVPAAAEIVLEGVVDPDLLEPEGPFGEASGYMGPRAPSPFLQVRCITHRPAPLCQALLSEFPPSESTLMRRLAFESVYLRHLREERGLRAVRAVAFHEAASSNLVAVVQLADPAPGEARAALRAFLDFEPSMGKVVLAVDEDVDPHDWQALAWVLAYRMQPARDVEVVEGRLARLDPSAEGAASSALLIDATRPRPYPPTSLPAQRHMEAARELWQRLGLPALEPREPWHGYELGDWPADLAADAARAAQGRYLETGEALARWRRRTEAEPGGAPQP